MHSPDMEAVVHHQAPVTQSLPDADALRSYLSEMVCGRVGVRVGLGVGLTMNRSSLQDRLGYSEKLEHHLLAQTSYESTA